MEDIKTSIIFIPSIIHFVLEAKPLSEFFLLVRNLVIASGAGKHEYAENSSDTDFHCVVKNRIKKITIIIIIIYII